MNILLVVGLKTTVPKSKSIALKILLELSGLILMPEEILSNRVSVSKLRFLNANSGYLSMNGSKAIPVPRASNRSYFLF